MAFKDDLTIFVQNYIVHCVLKMCEKVAQTLLRTPDDDPVRCFWDDSCKVSIKQSLIPLARVLLQKLKRLSLVYIGGFLSFLFGV